jgi:hypothetical protein
LTKGGILRNWRVEPQKRIRKANLVEKIAAERGGVEPKRQQLIHGSAQPAYKKTLAESQGAFLTEWPGQAGFWRPQIQTPPKQR